MSSGRQRNESLLTHLSSVLVPESRVLFLSLALRDTPAFNLRRAIIRQLVLKLTYPWEKGFQERDKGPGRRTASLGKALEKRKEACLSRQTWVKPATRRGKGEGGWGDLWDFLTDSMDRNISCSTDE